MDIKKTAAIFKALSDENRLRILSALEMEESCACVILEELSISQPTLSHHMKILVEAGLVTSRKDGKWVRYALSEEGLSHISAFVESLEMKGSKAVGNQTC